MAKKRFTDIEIWDKEWYMELKPKHKCLMKYIFDKCDAAGCWKPNWKLASLHIGEIVIASDLFHLPKDQYEILESGKVFIPDFINFQYGQLSEKSPAHKPIFSAIEKNNLIDRVFNRVSNTLQEKEKEKEKDKEEEKGGMGECEQVLWINVRRDFLNSGDWIFKFCSDKNLDIKEFDKVAKEFLADIELKEDYKDIKELKRHFTNWYNLKKKNGTQRTSATSGNKLGVEQLLQKARTDYKTSS